MRVFWILLLICILLTGCASAGLASNPVGADVGSVPFHTSTCDPGTTVPTTTMPSSMPVSPPKVNPWDDEQVILLKLPQEIDLQVRQDYCKATDQLSPDQVSLRVLGVFHETYVMFVDVRGMMYAQVLTSETVSGYTFWYSCYHTMDVYHNGEFYSLQEAFDMGILTTDELAEVSGRYYGVYPNLVPDYNQAYE